MVLIDAAEGAPIYAAAICFQSTQRDPSPKCPLLPSFSHTQPGIRAARKAIAYDSGSGQSGKGEGVWRDIKKISFKFRHLTSLVDHCQMVKDGIFLLPKPDTDRPWSDDPILDMYLEEQHWKRKEMGEDARKIYMEERMMEEDAWY